MQPSFLRRASAAAAAALVFALPASATWSIVVVNTQTGEVVVAAATCLENFNLIKDLPVMRVGHGGAVSQGLIDFGCVNYHVTIDPFCPNGAQVADVTAIAC